MDSSFMNESNIENNDTKSQLELNTTSEQDTNFRDTKEGIIKANLSKWKGSAVETNFCVENVNDAINVMNVEIDEPDADNIDTNSPKPTNTASTNTNTYRSCWFQHQQCWYE